MPDFTRRSYQSELMDDLTCGGEVVRQTLSELETINALLGGNQVTINALSRILSASRERSFSIVDVGCGSGEVLRQVRKWSRKKGLELTLTGVDANPNIIDYARAHTPTDMRIDYEVRDIFSPEFDLSRFDIVVGTLFFHHFTEEELIRFFTRVRENVSIGLIVNDIHRHPLAYHSIRFLTRLLSRSPMVRHDAPVSVLRAFNREEVSGVIRKAGFSQISLRWMWAFRWQVIATKA